MRKIRTLFYTFNCSMLQNSEFLAEIYDLIYLAFGENSEVHCNSFEATLSLHENKMTDQNWILEVG